MNVINHLKAYLFFFACMICTSEIFAKTIYVFPFYGIDIKWHVIHFESLGYTVKTTNLRNDLDDFAGLIVFDQPPTWCLDKIWENCPVEKRILCLLEPPVIAPQYYDPSYHGYFAKVFTMFDDMVDNKKYFKIYYPQDSLMYVPSDVAFENKKLCTIVVGNKTVSHPLELYSARKASISYFEKMAPLDFDLYGSGWNSAEFSSARGNIPSKAAVLRNYKFCICYENMKSQRGYITEKIFDALIAGCVPVYWGADNIADYVPGECFIDRRNFVSDEELYEFLISVDKERYQIYQEAIQRFLISPQAFKFSYVNFVDTLIRCFEPAYDKTKVFNPEQLEKLNQIKA